MAKRKHGGRRGAPILGAVVGAGLALAAMPVLSAAAAPANGEAGTGESGSFVAAPLSADLAGFEGQTQTSVPGFEPVLTPAAAPPRSASLEPRAMTER